MSRSPAAERRLQIGELARRAGVSHRTIHFYESRGLLHPIEREGAGYRYYDATAVKRLQKILQLKKLGLSLDEIGAVIDLYFEDETGAKGKRRVLDILRGQLAETDTKIADLVQFRREVQENIARLEGLLADAEAAAEAGTDGPAARDADAGGQASGRG